MLDLWDPDRSQTIAHAGQASFWEDFLATFQAKRIEPVDARYHFDKAKTISSLDADFLGTGPAKVRYALDFMLRRASAADPAVSNRLYAVGSTPSLTVQRPTIRSQ